MSTNLNDSGTGINPASAHHSESHPQPPRRSYAHLTRVTASLAIHRLDAALHPRSNPRSSTPFTASSAATTTGHGAHLKVSQVQDPVRVAAQRKVLTDRYERLSPVELRRSCRAQTQTPRKRVEASVFRRLTTSTTADADSNGNDEEQVASGEKRKRPATTATRSRIEKRITELVKQRKRQHQQSTLTVSGAGEKGIAAVGETDTYSPFSQRHLLDRLASFTLSRYALYKAASEPPPLPSSALSFPVQPAAAADGERMRRRAWLKWKAAELGPVRMARFGWKVEAEGNRETVRCAACRRTWDVRAWLAQTDAGAGEMSADSRKKEQSDVQRTRQEGMELQTETEKEAEKRCAAYRMHQDGCPWTVKWCDASLYTLAPQPRPTLLIDLLDDARAVRRLLSGLGANPRCVRPAVLLRANLQDADVHVVADAETTLATIGAALQETAQRVARLDAAQVEAGAVGDTDFLTSAEAMRVRDVDGTGGDDEEWTSDQARVAILLSLVGWRCAPASSAASTATPSIHCHLCHRVVGLWSFLDTDSQTDSLAALPELDPVREHREFCAWLATSTGIETRGTGGEIRAVWETRLRLLLGRPGHGGSSSPTSAADVRPIGANRAQVLRSVRAVFT